MVVPDEGVDLGSVNVVQLLHGILDLSLVASDINDEYQGVVLFDLLHRRLRIERVDDCSESIHAGCVRDRLSGVFGITGEAEGLGAVERDAGSDFAGGMAVCALQCSFFGGLRLGGVGGGGLTLG